MKIDLDRGVTHRAHPSGINIYMYKNEPGVFYNALGKQVSPELARQAGFDVDALLKEKAKRERIKHAQEMIEREFSEETTRETAKEKNGYRVVHVGFGRYVVEDDEGNRLNKTPISKEQAMALLDEMAPSAGGKTDSKEE